MGTNSKTPINMERLAKLEARMLLDDRVGFSGSAMLIDGINSTDIKVYEWFILYEKYRYTFSEKPPYLKDITDRYELRSKEAFIRNDCAKMRVMGGFVDFLKFAAYLNPKSERLPVSELSQKYQLSERVECYMEIQKKCLPEELIPMSIDEKNAFKEKYDDSQV